MVDGVKLIINSDVGLPEPVEVSRDELRDALLANPSIFVDTLSGVVRPRVPLLPLDTSIERMLSPEQFEALPEGARKLTKADLIALGGWGDERKSPAQLGLTVDDIQGIRDVFGARMGAARRGGNIGVSVSCCCCTPCCCAAVEMEPILLGN